MTADLNQQLGTTDIAWNLKDLYKGLEDLQIERDMSACLNEAQRIKGEYSDKVANLDASGLLRLVKELEALAVKKGGISTFAFLNFTTKTKEAEASAFMQKIRELGSKISTETVFFELEWNKVDDVKVDDLLKDPVLIEYKHFLQSLRRYAPHLLPTNEEKLLLEISPVGRGAWTLLFDKVMGHLKFGEKQRTEEEVLSDLYSPQQEVRKKAAAELTDGLKSQLHVLTHITNTLLAEKMIDDGMRKYPSWLSSMNIYNQLDDSTVNTLVESVTSRYDIVKRYYVLKKKLLNYDQLNDYDRYAPLPNMPGKLVSWEECKELVLKSFNDFSPKMAEIAAMFFDKKWIHAPIIDGKRGGAFAHPCTPKVHPYVMVNYTGNIRDVSTVAHELGHGVHQYLAAGKGYYNSDTPLVLAETASVFAELLLFKHQLELLSSPAEKTAFIAQKLESIFATVFRQIAMNRFENLSHTNRRDGGELSAEQLSKYWLSTQSEMFGDSVNLSEDYSIWWSYIPHFLNSPGYVYSYAFGELLVLSLYQCYLSDKAPFVDKYLDLLAAGGSASPENLVAPFGLNLKDPAFWQGGLNLIDDMLKSIE